MCEGLWWGSVVETDHSYHYCSFGTSCFSLNLCKNPSLTDGSCWWFSSYPGETNLFHHRGGKAEICVKPAVGRKWEKRKPMNNSDLDRKNNGLKPTIGSLDHGKLVGGFKYFYFHPYLGKWSNLTQIWYASPFYLWGINRRKEGKALKMPSASTKRPFRNPNRKSQAFGGNSPTAVLTALRFWKARSLREKGDLAAVGDLSDLGGNFYDLFGMVSELRWPFWEKGLLQRDRWWPDLQLTWVDQVGSWIVSSPGFSRILEFFFGEK